MKRFERILCVLDPESSAETAILQAVRLAADHQAEITFTAVVREARYWRGSFPGTGDRDRDLQAVYDSRKAALQAEIHRVAPHIEPNVVILSGIGFIEIIKAVRRDSHDLVIKCAENASWMHRFFSSEDMHLLRKCPCPVLMLKPGQTDAFKTVLATVDVNDDDSLPTGDNVQEELNREVLAYAALFSMADLTTLHVGAVWNAYAEDFCRYGAFSRVPQEDVDQYVEQTRGECATKLDGLLRDMGFALGKESMKYLSPRSHLVKGKASREIPQMAEQYGVDLVVMGTVGRVGIPGLIIGNTAESILEQVHCSVLTIKPDGFQTPVI